MTYNDRLLMFMLRNRAPERFADGKSPAKLGAVGKMEVERLKKEWREEWEAEQRRVSPAEVRASIDRKVDTLRQQVDADKAAQWEALSEETREAIRRAEALKARDLARAGLLDAGAKEVMALPAFPAPAPPPETSREEEPDGETGPRVRTVKDESWI